MKTTNEYVGAVGAETYNAIPKAVWAAIAISAVTDGGDVLDEATERVMDEWRALHRAGIVPQRPPRQWFVYPNELEDEVRP